MGSIVGSFSLWHWLVVLAALFLVAFPVFRILRRLGLSGWWTILAVIPWINLVLLWVVAFVRWPIETAQTKEL
jgi:uncharacterized membrane protein YhaH (DUF805 family)